MREGGWDGSVWCSIWIGVGDRDGASGVVIGLGWEGGMERVG